MIIAYLDELQLPPLELDFINTNLENSTDVVTLNNQMYTDFAGDRYALWSFQWESMTESDYNALRSVYDYQFTEQQYVTLNIPYYGVSGVPVRMTINEKDIWNHCGDVKNVKITLRETAQLPEVS